MRYILLGLLGISVVFVIFSFTLPQEIEISKSTMIFGESDKI